MNEVETLNVFLIAKEYKHFCISIGTFTDFLKPDWRSILDPTTDRKILQTGRYAKFGKCYIWVCKTMQDGFVKVSNQDIANAKEEGKWSPPVPIAHADQLERYASLKAFW